MKRYYYHILLSFIIVFIITTCKEKRDESNSGSLNKAAEIIQDSTGIIIKYDTEVIFKGQIQNKEGTYYLDKIIDTANNVINQVYSWTSKTDQPLVIKGVIEGSPESFPCEVDRHTSRRSIVRHTVGLSHSLLNHAVYDRYKDWTLSVDFRSNTKIVPIDTDSLHNRFEITTSGAQVGLRFRPEFFRKHRGLSFFKPWTYQVWNKPVVGWCSWFAYFTEIDEEKIKKTADILSETLVPFGLEYLQIDDGYQQLPEGPPETWIIPNNKFLSGLDSLSKYIAYKGLKPGIWTTVGFHEEKFVKENTELFIRDKQGNPFFSRWVGYSIDGSNPEVAKQLLKPIYGHLSKTGWQYFKIDGLRHLRYDGYNSHIEYFSNNNNLIKTYRNVVQAIREEVGMDNFLLACWGIRPELIGIIDACRIGTDGYGYSGLAQFNSFNNIIWRNDPDHIELSEKESYRSCMITSLTGSLFMLTDKPETYLTNHVEPVKRSIPVLFTTPGQIYDVDPSRSMYINRINSEISGGGQKVFDASTYTPYNLFQLEINKQYEQWIVLGRTEEKERYIYFKDLGLEPLNTYHIFEFWSKTYLGEFTEYFEPISINVKYNCQLFCIRKKEDHPQLLATNRHISCGGLEINELNWDENRIYGISKLVPNDPYEIYIYEPSSYKMESYSFTGADLIDIRKTGNVRMFKLISKSTEDLEWIVNYSVQK